MIDTIVLTLTKRTYYIIDPELFVPSARWCLTTTPIPGIQSKQNPTKKELKNGTYKPHLTLSYRITKFGTYEPLLKIELSLPKLMFGNNFQELRYKDFPAIVLKLVAILHTMGVAVTAPDLAKADIAAIHYSKNIALTDGSTPYHYICKLKEANVEPFLDVNQTSYRNEGHCYKWHANSYEIVFYDKIRDLEKAKQSEKRALEKDSAVQLHIFEKFKKRKNLEFLRMEVRLNKRQKIKQLFQKLGIKASFTFKALFKPAISKKILLHYIDEIEQRRSCLLDYKTVNDKALLTLLVLNNPQLTAKQALCMFGFKKALEVANVRELKIMFASYNQRSWSRLLNDATKLKLSTAHQSFAVIREQITKFKPITNTPPYF